MPYPRIVFVGIMLLTFSQFNVATANETIQPESPEVSPNRYSTALKQLGELVTAKKYDQAFDFGNANAEFLGEPKFDYLVGLAALQSKRAHEAVFAFERVINFEPKWHQARFHLASAYLLANNLPAARAELEQLSRVSNLPAAVENNIPILRRTINRRMAKNSESFVHAISIGGGYDSNVNAGSAEDSIFIPALGGDISLSANSQATDSSFLTGTYVGQYSKMITQKQKLSISGLVNVNQFNEASDFNRMAGSISGKYTFIENKLSYFAGANIAPLWLDSELYRTYLGADFGGSYSISDDLSFNATARLGTTINQFDERLDLNATGISVSATLMKNDMMHQVTVDWLMESANSNAEYNGKDTIGIQYLARKEIANKLLYTGTLSWSSSSHHAPHPVFEIERDESLLHFNNSLTYRLWPESSIVAGLGFQNKSSNVKLYDYNRVDLNLSFNMSF